MTTQFTTTFDAPKTKVLNNWLRQRAKFITGLTINPETGVTRIFTTSDKWGDTEEGPIERFFEGATECKAINQMKEFERLLIAEIAKENAPEPDHFVWHDVQALIAA